MQTIIHADSLSTHQRNTLLAEVGGNIVARSNYFVIQHSEPVDSAALEKMRGTLGIDINPLPQGYDPAQVGLLVTDMDSTMISIECIDEIAGRLNIKPQVAAITEAAMQGEIDFETALRKRVSLLQGLPEKELNWVYEHRLRLNAGAQILLNRASAAGISIALVSGGFTFFTDRLKQSLPIDYALANRLRIENGILTGGLDGDLVGADAKAAFLLALCGELNIEPRQSIAVGDGANDAKMLSASGLGIAYRAKPALQSVADARLNHSDLRGICALLLL